MAKKSKPKRKGKKKRNYKAEYRRRLALGQRRSLTVQEARGRHPGEKRAKKTRHGPVSKKFYTGRWQVGTMTRSTPEKGFTFDKTRQLYIKRVADLRTYYLTDEDRATPYETAKRLARNAARNYEFFSVRFLVTELPYGNAVLKFGWTEPLFIVDESDLFDAIYNGYQAAPSYWGLRNDEPDEGRRTLIIGLAISI